MSRRGRLAFEAAFLLLALLATAPLWLGRSWCAADVRMFTLPDLFRFQAALETGWLREWEPALFCGYPAHAAILGVAFYPPHWLLLALLPLLLALKASYLLHAWLLARGGAALAGELGASRRAGLFVGGALLLSGSSSGHTLDLNVLIALGWTPWVLLLAARAARRPGPLAPLLLAGAFGFSLLQSHPQWAFYEVLMAGLVVLALVPPRGLARPLLRVGGGFAFAGLLAAPLLLPGAEYVLEVHGRVRPDWYEYATANGARLADLPGWLRGDPPAGPAEPFHPGAACWLLALVGLLTGDRRAAWWRAGVLVGAVGLFLAPGGGNPLFRLLVHLPPLNGFRCPGRALLLVEVGLALLAGGGLDRLLRWRVERTSVARAAGALLFGLLLLELSLAHLARNPSAPDAELLERPRLAAPIAASENPRTLDLADHMAAYPVLVRRLRRNSGVPFGVEYFSGYESLPPGPQEAWMQELPLLLREDPRAFAEACAALSIRWIVVDEAIELPGLRPVDADAGARLWEHPGARPQVYLLPAGGGPPAPVAFERPRAGLVRVPAVRCERAARLVVASAWYPGWIARVDGVEREPEVEGGLFMALDLGPGTHAVELAFENQRLAVGLRLGAAAWIAWATALWVLRRRSVLLVRSQLAARQMIGASCPE